MSLGSKGKEIVELVVGGLLRNPSTASIRRSAMISARWARSTCRRKATNRGCWSSWRGHRAPSSTPAVIAPRHPIEKPDTAFSLVGASPIMRMPRSGPWLHADEAREAVWHRHGEARAYGVGGGLGITRALRHSPHSPDSAALLAPDSNWPGANAGCQSRTQIRHPQKTARLWLAAPSGEERSRRWLRPRANVHGVGTVDPSVPHVPFVPWRPSVPCLVICVRIHLGTGLRHGKRRTTGGDPYTKEKERNACQGHQGVTSPYGLPSNWRVKD